MIKKKKSLKPTIVVLSLMLAQCMESTAAIGHQMPALSEDTKPFTHKGHREWLKFSQMDFNVAKKLSESEEFFGPVLYHIQQGVEKALKAYLVFKKFPVPRTHDLVELLNICATTDTRFQSLHTSAASLSPYATITRYPNKRFDQLSLSTAQLAMQQALEILTVIKSKING